mgnify:CR=1 FL=1
MPHSVDGTYEGLSARVYQVQTRSSAIAETRGNADATNYLLMCRRVKDKHA